jgi:hypothetical protein
VMLTDAACGIITADGINQQPMPPAIILTE